MNEACPGFDLWWMLLGLRYEEGGNRSRQRLSSQPGSISRPQLLCTGTVVCAAPGSMSHFAAGISQYIVCTYLTIGPWTSSPQSSCPGHPRELPSLALQVHRTRCLQFVRRSSTPPCLTCGGLGSRSPSAFSQPTDALSGSATRSAH